MLETSHLLLLLNFIYKSSEYDKINPCSRFNYSMFLELSTVLHGLHQHMELVHFEIDLLKMLKFKKTERQGRFTPLYRGIETH